ncbi:hypothetical protein PR202_gb25627 [Eleusine coracana subsp. coracana]|uniref:Uncharacterized protein n=1 Tax=Eleusine coracana subsp. coracana TaxID=191504 RepID=A0AAV5FQM3_ELECO|nr:hypothetical protein QOZ80_8BG0649960 [Eleusine coracana subsp. coracana]GJN36735.1 hypothetical protein PR202_gb25627 [Eleusine coracana subsp. coracana]
MVLEAARSGTPAAIMTGSGASMMAVHSHRLSSVVPSSVTGDSVDYELADADLLHKLHYLHAAHVFRAPAPGDVALTVRALKEPMFPWLDVYFPVAGRLRRREEVTGAGDGGGDSGGEAALAGRPYVRCNDCGVRVVEADCDATVDECMEAEAERGGMCGALCYDKVVGPELFFSPLLYVQITRFKCGGLAIGFTWAHVIGDIPSAAACFRAWTQLVSGNKPLYPTLRDPAAVLPTVTPPASAKKAPPPSVKLAAAPVGDHWAVPTGGHDMAPFSFHVTEQQLEALRVSVGKGSSGCHVGPFELISALTWRALAAIRGAQDHEEEEEATRTVTVVKAGAAASGGGGLSNDHRIGHVVAAGPVPPAEAGVGKLVALLAGARLDEGEAAAAVAAAGGGDVVVYGANLTFVDAGGVDVYGGMELAGRRPAHVEYAVAGVGGGGAAVVHRDAGGRGRTVAAVVRRGEVDHLRAALRDALRVA